MYVSSSVVVTLILEPPISFSCSTVTISGGRLLLGILFVTGSIVTFVDRDSLVRCTEGALSVSSDDREVFTIRSDGLIGGGAGGVLGIVAIFSLRILPCLAESAAFVSVDVSEFMILVSRFLTYMYFTYLSPYSSSTIMLIWSY